MFASAVVREKLTFSGDCYQEGDIFRLTLAFRVAKNGKVKDVEVEKSSGERFVGRGGAPHRARIDRMDCPERRSFRCQGVVADGDRASPRD